MQYYDDYGSTGSPNWRVQAYIQDNFGQGDGYTSTNTLIQNTVPLPIRNTYFNRLDSSTLVPAAGNMDFGTVGYGPQTRQPADAVNIYPLAIRNTGNSDITPIRVNATHIPGVTTQAGFPATNAILASWFYMAEASSNPCTGTPLVHATFVNTGIASVNNGLAAQGSLRVCLTDVQATATVQSYSTTATRGFAWVLDTTFAYVLSLIRFIRFNLEFSILFVAVLRISQRRKLKKRLKTRNKLLSSDELLNLDLILKKKYNLSIEELLKETKEKQIKEEIEIKSDIKIPLCIFNKKLSPAESLCKYLKENKKLRFSEIAKLINRDERSIWTNYNNSVKKIKEKIKYGKKTEEKILVSINIFADRRLSILESVVKYLKEREYRNYEIAELLGKDQRNIYTVHKRVEKKLE